MPALQSTQCSIWGWAAFLSAETEAFGMWIKFFRSFCFLSSWSNLASFFFLTCRFGPLINWLCFRVDRSQSPGGGGEQVKEARDVPSLPNPRPCPKGDAFFSGVTRWRFDLGGGEGGLASFNARTPPLRGVRWVGPGGPPGFKKKRRKGGEEEWYGSTI